MSETKPDKKRRKKVGEGVKALRDQKVLELAIKGEKTQAIADQIGLSRQAVSGILNSDDAKELLKGIDERLKAGIDDAIKLVVSEARCDYEAARDLLRNFGSMKNKVQLQQVDDEGNDVRFADTEAAARIAAIFAVAGARKGK